MFDARFFKHELLCIYIFVYFFSLGIHKPSSDSIKLVSKYSRFHVVRDDIVGHYFVMLGQKSNITIGFSH